MEFVSTSTANELTEALHLSSSCMSIDTLVSPATGSTRQDEQEVATFLSHMANGTFTPSDQPSSTSTSSTCISPPATPGLADSFSGSSSTASLCNRTSNGHCHLPPAPPSVPSIPYYDMQRAGEDGDRGTFLSRVTDLPVVNSTIRTIGEVYESGKNTSRVLKYSAETVERIFDNTKPVLNRVNIALEPQLGQLNQFACRQLDKLEKNYPIIKESPSAMYSNSKQVLGDAISKWTPNYSSDEPPSIMSHGDNELSGRKRQRHESDASTTSMSVASLWNSYLSTESLKSLKYCLQWLEYATSHIDNQIRVLQAGLQQWAPNSNTSNAFGSLLALAARVKREVVETLRKVVDIISKYAGNALPIEGRNLVRGFILNLPGRWASISDQMPGTTSMHESNPLPEAHRVLTLAQEINGTLKSTMAVFGQTFGSNPMRALWLLFAYAAAPVPSARANASAKSISISSSFSSSTGSPPSAEYRRETRENKADGKENVKVKESKDPKKVQNMMKDMDKEFKSTFASFFK